MHLALWDIPPSRCLQAAASDVLVERTSAEEALRLLEAHQVDVALLPSQTVLCQPGTFSVLPGVALASWSYPWAAIVLRCELAGVHSVAYPVTCTQEAFMARTVLREHYGLAPRFVPKSEEEDLHYAGEDASLVVGEDLPVPGRQVLDLGQEWFELAQYPMVWGLFATLRDAATPGMARSVVELVQAAEDVAVRWGNQEEAARVRHFYAESVRLRLDNLARAGLTSFADFLYFDGVVEARLPLPLYTPPGVDGPWWAGTSPHAEHG